MINIARMGRRSRVYEWLEPDKLLLIKGWKRNGLTNEEIAKNIGITRKPLQEWAAKHGDIRDSLKIGKEQANFMVENKLFAKAMQGNVTAMIFYLKNNWRDKYNDSSLAKEELELLKERTKLIKSQRRAIDEKGRDELSQENSLQELFDKLENDYLSEDDSDGA